MRISCKVTSDSFSPIQPAQRLLVHKQESDITERVFLYGSREELWLIRDFIYDEDCAPYSDGYTYSADLTAIMNGVRREKHRKILSIRQTSDLEKRNLGNRNTRLYTWHDAQDVSEHIATHLSEATISDDLMNYQSLRALGAGVQNILSLHEWVAFLRHFLTSRQVDLVTFTYFKESTSNHCDWFRAEMKDTINRTKSQRFIPKGSTCERSGARMPGKIIHRGVLRNSDQVSEHQHVSEGIRKTTPNTIDGFEKTYHFFGASEVFGTHLNNDCTIPSCFSKLIHSQGARVLNYGMGGVNFIDVVVRIMAATIAAGDTVFLALPFCVAEASDQKIMLDEFDFYDQSHVTHSGAQKIASALHAKYDTAKMHIDSLDVYEHARSLVDIYKKILLRVEVNEYQSEDIRSYCSYLELIKETRATGSVEGIGSVAVNCNPMTNGHLALIEYASNNVNFLYVIVIQEDKSEISFKDRYEMVKLACANLDNTQVIKGGQFVCTEYIAPEYFVKDEQTSGSVDFGMESFYFGNFIAPTLNIKKIFLGEEPICQVTAAYNKHMKATMPQYNIELTIIPRIVDDECRPISASRVRSYIKLEQWTKVQNLVPPRVFKYIRENKVL